MRNKTCTLGVISTVCVCVFTGLVKNWLRMFLIWQSMFGGYPLGSILSPADENALTESAVTTVSSSLFHFPVSNSSYEE